MLRIKKLDIFIIKSFALLFLGTFFVCLFIFMMQFLWRYVDELVGKGLAMSVLAKFFFYSGITLIPMSLPLAILLATLMTFGNFGERCELLAMKAAGISLIKVMRPLFFVVLFLSALSFYFQNVIGPRATTELYALIFSMKQKSPELDIPEGVFYDEIDGYNLYVKKKNPKNGMLYNVMIYNLSDGFENAHIIVADSGKLEMTADKKYLQLHLYSGESFENLKAQNMRSRNVPYRRESFREKHSIIEFDANFNAMDASYLSNQSAAKDMRELKHSIDSMTNYCDSIGRHYYKEAKRTSYRVPTLTSKDSLKLQEITTPINIDSLFQVQSISQRQKMIQGAQSRAQSIKTDLLMKSYNTSDGDKNIRRHWKDWWMKITLSLACIVFFFIGAPLGAIINKGGLGMPVIISVILFIFYYIIDNSFTKMARDGEIVMWVGMWTSTFVLAPFGAFLTYKANNDSVVFNMDAYKEFFRKLFGLRISRHIFKKEVIINDPDYPHVYTKLAQLGDECEKYAALKHFDRAPNYIRIFTNHETDTTIHEISEQLESLIEELSNSKNGRVLGTLNNFPILIENAHKSPSRYLWINLLVGLILPAGLLYYLRILRFGKRLDKDLKTIVKTSKDLRWIMEKDGLVEEKEEQNDLVYKTNDEN